MSPVHLILYDGACGLCNRLNRFVLDRDRVDRFRFASLQGDFARDLLRGFGIDAEDLNTFYVIADFRGKRQRALSRGRAALFVLKELGGVWKGTAVLSLLPQPVLDWSYKLLALHRYRWFGRCDACPVPSPEVRWKFVERVDEPGAQVH